MKKLAILIPSYKRPEVLRLTLNGLLENTSNNEDYEICVAVGLNKGSPEENTMVNDFSNKFKSKGIKFNSISYDENIGKARILNALFKLYAHGYDYVVTMDNDMVISKPWLYMIALCDIVDYDIMGFSSAKFWAHDPKRELCAFFRSGEYIFYKPYSVAGGMMLFHYKFLSEHPWTNFGGVYGRDDAEICLRTQKKYVYHTDIDWLEHDPLNSSTPVLKDYEDKKRALYKNGTTVFPLGWDE